MEIKNVGKRGTLFIFDDLGIPTNVYVINGKKHVYILDTYLGPDIMEQVNQYIEQHYGGKPYIVVNSHSHWDHVWGNSLYTSSLIIAHEKCKEAMELEGLKKLQKHSEYKRGEVVLTYPNLTFTDKILFEEDQVLIYYTPGHSEDEISVLDLYDKVLFVGDNLERPIPFIMWKNLEKYIDTLEDYLKIDANIIIGGHTACEDKGLVEHNLNYVKKVLCRDTAEFEVGEYADYHNTNMKWLSEN
jgi:glyoxylase-like metal-dependent hydrolase (beta-lactamase superfamily II)